MHSSNRYQALLNQQEDTADKDQSSQALNILQAKAPAQAPKRKWPQAIKETPPERGPMTQQAATWGAQAGGFHTAAELEATRWAAEMAAETARKAAESIAEAESARRAAESITAAETALRSTESVAAAESAEKTAAQAAEADATRQEIERKAIEAAHTQAKAAAGESSGGNQRFACATAMGRISRQRRSWLRSLTWPLCLLGAPAAKGAIGRTSRWVPTPCHVL